MEMDNLVRDGKPQTWIKEGSTVDTRRTILSIEGNKMTMDVPLSDSFNSKYAGPGGTLVVKIQPSDQVSQSGVENLHIQAPPAEMSHEQSLYNALRINGRDCWARKPAD